MPSLDRFSQGLPDPQEQPSVEACYFCGNTIHEGESAFEYLDDIYCDEVCITQKVLGQSQHIVVGS